jgi:hypothetical protein
MEDQIIKFHGNPSSGGRADTHKRTDGHDSANRHFMRLFDRIEQGVLWVLSTLSHLHWAADLDVCDMTQSRRNHIR